MSASAKIGLVSLGCPKNLVDSEELLGALMETGRAELVAAESPADVVVVNTCAFIESAKKESIDAILEQLARRDRGEIKKVIVAGCLAQRYGAELAAEIPEVDAYLGIQSAPQIAEAVFGRRGTALPMASNLVAPLTEKYPLIPPSRIRATAPWTAYLKVSEGCDHACTFCSIPSFRGKHRSKPLENIFEEARRLVDAGACELNLIAQDTTAYGMDLYKELALPRLLEGLGKIDGLKWVRLLYCYPTMMTDRLVKTMANTENVAHYVDIPLQHGADTMLKRMKRGGSVASYHRILERLRGAMPDIAIRTTFLVGFPGETDEEFGQLKSFVEEAKFDRVGVFAYSPEEGTPGHDMTPVVPKKVARERRAQLMEAQQPISLARNLELVGREIAVLMEAGGKGRSWRDAPEIDGIVRVTGAEGSLPGSWVRARVVEALPYDVIAEAI